MARSDLAGLSRVPVWRCLPSNTRRRLLEAAKRRVEPPGSRIFLEADPSTAVFLILSGTIRISKRVDDGSAFIALRGRFDWLGELSLEPAGRRSASAVVESQALLLEIPSELFVGALRDNADAAVDLLQLVAGRLRDSDAALVDAVRKHMADAFHAAARRRTRRPRADADPEGREDTPRFPTLRFEGSSPDAKRVRSAAAHAAQTSLTLLLKGERGTGKRLLARIIHERSQRSTRPFLVLDCEALGEPLLSAQLFGCSRGAVAGLRQGGTGAVERAAGGTLLLEHVECLPRRTQDLMFRLLEAGEYERLGSTVTRSVDVRIVASTAVDPDDLRSGGEFRGDLLERLCVLQISIPSLRTRRADVVQVLERLAAREAKRRAVAPLRFSPAAVRVVSLAPLDANGDTLETEVHRLYALLAPDTSVTPAHLSPHFARRTVTLGRYGDAVRSFKVELIREAILESQGNQSRAAERLGLHPSNLGRMMRDLGLD